MRCSVAYVAVLQVLQYYTDAMLHVLQCCMYGRVLTTVAMLHMVHAYVAMLSVVCVAYVSVLHAS